MTDDCTCNGPSARDRHTLQPLSHLTDARAGIHPAAGAAYPPRALLGHAAARRRCECQRPCAVTVPFCVLASVMWHVACACLHAPHRRSLVCSRPSPRPAEGTQGLSLLSLPPPHPLHRVGHMELCLLQACHALAVSVDAHAPRHHARRLVSASPVLSLAAPHVVASVGTVSCCAAWCGCWWVCWARR